MNVPADRRPLVLGVAGSPREGGNSTLLLQEALRGAIDAGGRAEQVVLSRLSIAPCRACDGCWSTGRCVVRDDFQDLSDRLIESAGIILATPIYFMGPSAQAKAFIDRAQSFWALRYVLRRAVPPPAGGVPRHGILITTAGHEVPQAGRCTELTVRYFLDALDARLLAALHVGNVDECGAVRQRPEALQEAYALGRRLVDVLRGSTEEARRDGQVADGRSDG